MPNLASQMRVAFSKIVSKTGCKSPGERADDAQHFRRRRLLLQRLGEVGRALAQLVEQPRILDGDDRLVGEGRDKLDLLVGERTHLVARIRVITPIGFPSRSSGTPSSVR